MAEKKDTARSGEEKDLGTTASDVNGGEMTNVRHQDGLDAVITELNELAEADEDPGRGFKIGDLVERATNKHKVRVADLMKKVRLSRTRMCECRVTAVAFKGEIRKRDVPFHFFTIAARAATTFAMTPQAALEEVNNQQFQSTREASRYFAEKRRTKVNGKALEAAALLVAKHRDLLDRCHHEDFRTVVARLELGSVKLVVADPAYDGARKSTTSATKRVIDGNNPADARKAIEDLLKLLADKMAEGGVLVLFRPGAALQRADSGLGASRRQAGGSRRFGA